MKKLILIGAIFGFAIQSPAQRFGEKDFNKTQVEIGLGLSLPFLNDGKELLRAEELRNNQLSYFQNPDGTHNQVGAYPRLSGFNFHIAFYKPQKNVNGLMLGAIVRNTQTGSQPEIGGYEEGYFFNFVTAGIAAKYYIVESTPLYLKAEFGISSVLTKNRFLNSGNQEFFHQFGIGPGGGIGLGYSMNAFKNRSKTLDFQVHYQYLQTRVEVNSIGDDNWRFGALHFSVAYNF